MSATKAKKAAPKKAPAKKAAPKKAAAPKSEVPSPFDDLNTAEDSQAVPGHFVDVISGPHEGRYGVLVDRDENSDNVVVRTRDSANERLLVKYTDLAPALAGRR